MDCKNVVCISLVSIFNQQTFEIVTYDNGFLYQFAPYAISSAPPLVLKVQGGEIVRAAMRSSFHPVLRDWIANNPKPESQGAQLNSWLAARTAVHSLLGRGAEALEYAGTHHDSAENFGREYCPVALNSDGACPQSLKVRPFVEALAMFLNERGYPVGQPQ